VIKEIRAITGLGLDKAKTLVESTPKPLKESTNKAEAEEIKKKMDRLNRRNTGIPLPTAPELRLPRGPEINFE